METKEINTGGNDGWTLDIQVWENVNPGTWAQARYLVHLDDDVLWTNSITDVLKAVQDCLTKLDVASRRRRGT